MMRYLRGNRFIKSDGGTWQRNLMWCGGSVPPDADG